MIPRMIGSTLVTGGGRGLGRAIAESLAAKGHGLGVLARTANEVDSVVELIREAGGRALGIVADVRDEALNGRIGRVGRAVIRSFLEEPGPEREGGGA